MMSELWVELRDIVGLADKLSLKRRAEVMVAVGACAHAGAAVNKENAPSNSAMAGRRPKKWALGARFRSARDPAGVEGAGLRAPASRQAHIMPQNRRTAEPQNRRTAEPQNRIIKYSSA